MYLLSARERGLGKALNIQREYAIRDWPTQWAAIEDADERKVAEGYLRSIAQRQRNVLAIQSKISVVQSR